MTREEVMAVLESYGIPTAYHHFPEGEAPDLPYQVYDYPGSSDVYADGVNYARITELDVRAYMNPIDFNLIDRIGQAFTEAGLAYERTVSYIDDEHMYEVLFELEV